MANNNINELKQYNIVVGELKRTQSRKKVIDIRLDNWDRLKAVTISDMPFMRNCVNGDKIGDIICSREEMQRERDLLLLVEAELIHQITKVDSKLDCLQDNHKFILERLYKDNMKFGRLVIEYNRRFGIAEYDTVQHHRKKAIQIYNDV